jgi:hypothetical protein
MLEDEKKTGFTDTPMFNSVICFTVLLHISLLGLATESSNPQLDAVIVSFEFCYIAEFACRVVLHGYDVMLNVKDMNDLILLLLRLSDTIFDWGNITAAFVAVKFLRIGRIFEAIGVLDKSDELRFLVQTTKYVYLSVFWFALVLFASLFAIGLICNIVIGESGEWSNLSPSDAAGPFGRFDRETYFGNLYQTLLTLLQAATLSDASHNIIRPVEKVYPNVLIFAFAFNMLITFGMLNLVLGNMIQACLSTSKERGVAAQMFERGERKGVCQLIIALIENVDENQDGELSAEELDNALAKYPQLTHLLEKVGLPAVSTGGGESLVRLFDKSGEGLIDYDELAGGLLALNDGLTSKDFRMLAMRVKFNESRLGYLDGKLAKMKSRVHDVQEKYAYGFRTVTTWSFTHQESQLVRKAKEHLRTVPHGPPKLVAKDVDTSLFNRKEVEIDDGPGLISFTKKYLIPDADMLEHLQLPGTPMDDPTLIRRPVHKRQKESDLLPSDGWDRKGFAEQVKKEGANKSFQETFTSASNTHRMIMSGGQ